MDEQKLAILEAAVERTGGRKVQYISATKEDCLAACQSMVLLMTGRNPSEFILIRLLLCNLISLLVSSSGGQKTRTVDPKGTTRRGRTANVGSVQMDGRPHFKRQRLDGRAIER